MLLDRGVESSLGNELINMLEDEGNTAEETIPALLRAVRYFIRHAVDPTQAREEAVELLEE